MQNTSASGILDDATLSPLERIRLSSALKKAAAELQALPAGPAGALRRVQMSVKVINLAKQLGAQSAHPPAPKEDPRVMELRAIASGKYDAEGIPALLSRIDQAMADGLGNFSESPDIEMAANEALDHWAAIEETWQEAA